ncbi:MAG: type II toxin-antitoxin system Phd/YefM family antitoxin [Acidobacteria bacterium]|nr:MAG: type II toxin-antitoxin system Phd/YefM family antitoxin [Acidobacteriota bacterium]
MADREIGAFEAKNRLSELLDYVEKGQRIYITRRGKRVAVLTNVEDERAESASDLLADIREFRAAAKRGRESLKKLIDEGRP